uniref:Uncharacterized protein n=1 Tax=Anopheles atroparvus TaxID=41427 RepID=A0A182JGT3_ANOAO
MSCCVPLRIEKSFDLRYNITNVALRFLCYLVGYLRQHIRFIWLGSGLGGGFLFLLGDCNGISISIAFLLRMVGFHSVKSRCSFCFFWVGSCFYLKIRFRNHIRCSGELIVLISRIDLVLLLDLKLDSISSNV